MKPIDVDREVEFLEKIIQGLREGKATPQGYALNFIWHGLQRMQEHELDIHLEDFDDVQLETIQHDAYALAKLVHEMPKEKLVKRIDYKTCPACGCEDIKVNPICMGKEGTDEKHDVDIKTCRACGAVFGVFPDWDSTTTVVKNEWYEGEVTRDTPQLWYDFMWPELEFPKGRRHGMFEVTTRKITQTG